MCVSYETSNVMIWCVSCILMYFETEQQRHADKTQPDMWAVTWSAGKNANNFYELSPVTFIISIHSLGTRVASAAEKGTRKGTDTVDLSGCGGLDGVVSIVTRCGLDGPRIEFW